MSQVVRSVQELVEALGAGVDGIEVQGSLSGMPMIALGPGVKLRGGTLSFGAKGVRLTRDNELDGVTVLTEDDEVAILNDTSVADLGTLTLRGVRTTGQVLLLAADAVRAGHVLVDGLQIDRADVRGRVERPRGFGVEALQGAFTLWNRQPDPAVVLTGELLDIAVGSAETPLVRRRHQPRSCRATHSELAIPITVGRAAGVLPSAVTAPTRGCHERSDAQPASDTAGSGAADRTCVSMRR